MPEIEIRPVEAADIPLLAALDHHYSSDYVWQMDVQQIDGGQVTVNFRETRLPRSVKVEYPRPARALLEDWEQRSGLLVAGLQGEPIGYTSLALSPIPQAAWMTDLVVARRLRRNGIGTALALAALEWSLQHRCRRLILETQPKNNPAIRLAQKLGFEFCGYNDRYYANGDIGLFFSKWLF